MGTSKEYFYQKFSIVNFYFYLLLFHHTHHLTNVAEHEVNLISYISQFCQKLAVLRFKSFQFDDEFPEDIEFF